jgi:pyridoxal phosphate enzyme (YggS family)
MAVLENFNKIDNYLNQLKRKVTLVVISKTFSLENIAPLIDFGHKDYGENKVQEATEKWSTLLSVKKNIKLHMVGKLQSNKASEAVNIFSYIHSLDNEKLANKLSSSEKNFSKKLKYFIQVNLGNESQKFGIAPHAVREFSYFCINELNLNVIGLMCLPPINESPEKYFISLKQIGTNLKLNEFSMGMSNDYKIAIESGSTFIRVGSGIFGNRI